MDKESFNGNDGSFSRNDGDAGGDFISPALDPPKSCGRSKIINRKNIMKKGPAHGAFLICV